CARGASRQDRRHQTRGSRTPAPRFLGRVPLVARGCRALGRRPRPILRTRALPAPARRARRVHLRARRLELAAPATLAAATRVIQFETITCPYCWESIEIGLDLSVDAQQQVEDCSVCCRPIVVRYSAT